LEETTLSFIEVYAKGIRGKKGSIQV